MARRRAAAVGGLVLLVSLSGCGTIGEMILHSPKPFGGTLYHARSVGQPGGFTALGVIVDFPLSLALDFVLLPAIVAAAIVTETPLSVGNEPEAYQGPPITDVLEMVDAPPDVRPSSRVARESGPDRDP